MNIFKRYLFYILVKTLAKNVVIQTHILQLHRSRRANKISLVLFEHRFRRCSNRTPTLAVNQTKYFSQNIHLFIYLYLQFV